MNRNFGIEPRIQSIAVLPLDNYSGDPSQDYFAEGMTDELMADLARISQLRVISRGSAMQFKGEGRPPTPDIGVGLFLGSGATIGLAGPGVVAYLVSAIVAAALGLVLAEMAIVHPVSGAFAVYADEYVGRWAETRNRSTRPPRSPPAQPSSTR